jgi:hypothetical protein
MKKLLYTLALFCAFVFGSSTEAAAQTLINEININPPGTDNPCEYIEIRGTPGAALNNTYFVAIEGDGTPSGTADLVVNLGTRVIGSNGILIITGTTACPGRTIAAGATQVTEAKLDTGTSGLENGTITFLLVTSPFPIVEGTDYDTNNDGTLEGLPAGAIVLDAIGVIDETFGDIVYFGQVVTQVSGTPNAITRFAANNTPRSSSAFYGGFLETAGGSGTNNYNTTNASANFPTGGVLTPGAPNVGTFAPRDVLVDFNGDGRSDYVVTRSASVTSQTTWFIADGATGAQRAAQFGTGVELDGGGDRAVPEDFDGDGKDDIAVWRRDFNGRSYFFMLLSSNNTFQSVQFGKAGDNPTIVADYDGDNKADLAVLRPPTSPISAPCGGVTATWFYRPSATPGVNFNYICWGRFQDYTALGDYDGDNKTDIAVFRPSLGAFFVNKSGGGTETVFFGSSTDIPIPGDYDGDGRTDYALARQNAGAPMSFFVRTQADATQTYQFGASTDIPVPADYSGDGKTDIAVWRPSNGTFYVRPAQTSGTADFAFKWGQTGDSPTAKYNVGWYIPLILTVEP